MSKQLRDYQEDTLAKMDRYLHKKGGQSGIVHLATGLGKTVVTTHFVERYANPKTGKRTIVVGGVNQVLTMQMRDAFENDFPWMRGAVMWGKEAVPALGIIMNRYNDVKARVVIASIQTLCSGIDMNAARKPPEFEPITKADIIISNHGTIHLNPKSKRRYLVSPRVDEALAAGGVFHYWVHDEAHHSVADGSVLIIARLQQIHEVINIEPMKIIGNTATPARADDRGLHTLYETLFVSYDYKFGQRHGYLVPFAEPLRILVDMAESNSQDIITSKTVVRYAENWADVLTQGWLEKGQGRPTFAYVSDMNGGTSHIEASRKLAQTMQEAGIRAAHVDGTGCLGPDGSELDKKDQRKLLRMLGKGELDVITNYGVLIEGVDVPQVSCVLNARRISQDNPVLLTQMLGRGLRPAPNKTDFLILEATGDKITLNGIAELGGFKVDPTMGAFIEDFDIELIFDEIVRLCNERGADVAAWQMNQKRFASQTITDAFNFAFRRDLDNVNQTHLRCLQDCIDWCNDEDKLMGGEDLKDMRVGSNIHGINQSYDIIQISHKSKAAWFAEETSALMSLSVAAGLSFVLHPPSHTRARLAKEALQIVKDGDLHELTEDKSAEQLEKMQQFLTKAVDLFENFTLWSVNTAQPWASQISGQYGGLWAKSDPALDALESYAFEFAREEVENYTPGFAEKKNKKSWAYEEPTDKQKVMYKSVAGEEPKSTWSKGELSSRINHIAAVRPVEQIVSKFEAQIDKLKEIL